MTARGVVLVADDEPHVREIVAAALTDVAARVLTAGSTEEALEMLREENVDAILSDLRMPGMDGLEFLARVREEQPGARFALFSAHGDMDVVVRALRLGASDFLAKPFDNGELRAVVTRLLAAPASAVPVVSPDDAEAAGKNAAGLIGGSPAFLRCLETARKAARADSSVLVTGESGTGKEGVARFIHQESARRDGPFIAVNCGAIPESLIESELFGHVRGAFTGALSDRPGKLLLAHGGTLFLDEIGEMPPALQVRLLRALQERVVEPVGGAPVASDFRVVAATHRDLPAAVRDGRFREDLWFRLNVIPLAVPPLRDRGDDVVLLARHYFARFTARYGSALALAAGHENLLRGRAWPGNVRELINVVERAVVLAEDGVPAFEPEPYARAGEPDGNERMNAGEGAAEAVGSVVRERRRAAEEDVIRAALESSGGNKTRAAAALGISRRGLLYKIKEYGIG